MALFGKKKKEFELPAPVPTMANADLRPGARLTLRAETKSGEIITLFTSFEEPISQEDFLAAAPMQGSNLYPINKGDKFTARYLSDNAYYDCDVEAVSRVVKENLQYLLLRCVAPLKRGQRRGEFRVDVYLETRLLLALDSDPAQYDKTRPPLWVAITNVSGGGIATCLKEEIPANGYVHLEMPEEIFSDRRLILCQTRSVRAADVIQTGSGFKYFAGLQFIFANNAEKDHVVRYTFDRQRKGMK